MLLLCNGQSRVRKSFCWLKRGAASSLFCLRAGVGLLAEERGVWCLPPVEKCLPCSSCPPSQEQPPRGQPWVEQAPQLERCQSMGWMGPWWPGCLLPFLHQRSLVSPGLPTMEYRAWVWLYKVVLNYQGVKTPHCSASHRCIFAKSHRKGTVHVLQ